MLIEFSWKEIAITIQSTSLPVATTAMSFWELLQLPFRFTTFHSSLCELARQALQSTSPPLKFPTSESTHVQKSVMLDSWMWRFKNNHFGMKTHGCEDSRQIIFNMLDSWMWETHGCENVGFMDVKDSWVWKCWIHGCEMPEEGLMFCRPLTTKGSAWANRKSQLYAVTQMPLYICTQMPTERSGKHAALQLGYTQPYFVALLPPGYIVTHMRPR